MVKGTNANASQAALKAELPLWMGPPERAGVNSGNGYAGVHAKIEAHGIYMEEQLKTPQEDVSLCTNVNKIMAVAGLNYKSLRSLLTKKKCDIATYIPKTK